MKQQIRRLASALLILFSCLQSLGQVVNSDLSCQPYIEVIGTAEKEVVPNEIYIGIVIKERYENRVKLSIESQEEKLRTALVAIGIDISNLYLSDADAGYVRVSWQTKDVLEKRNYTLKVSDAASVGKVFQELEKLQISDAFISGVSHSDIDELKKEIRISAIKAAKEKADYLLNALGEETGKPIFISENKNDVVQLRAPAFEGAISYRMSEMIDKVSTTPENVIQFQKIKLSANILVRFTIK